MKSKHIPIRTCIYTKKRANKYEMIRVVMENGIYVLDKEMKKQSRGKYIYPCEKLKELIYKNKKYNLSDQVKEEILSYMLEKGGDFGGK
ncbi:YlxR family protein [Caviibacter abscessus]|uniref:YlxR family protein n=1 Tax=Caviibacter abscessus TaxID=1766719 RepID=UPI0008319792|nr:DUF448 domain-containing protein [Caviibacter abscessus]